MSTRANVNQLVAAALDEREHQVALGEHALDVRGDAMGGPRRRSVELEQLIHPGRLECVVHLDGVAGGRHDATPLAWSRAQAPAVLPRAVRAVADRGRMHMRAARAQPGRSRERWPRSTG